MNIYNRNQLANNNDTAVLIFSKDRAMQLDAALRSYFLHCLDNASAEIIVLYLATNERHKRQYEQLVREFKNVNFVPETDFRGQCIRFLRDFRFVMFMVDDTMFTDDFQLGSVRSLLLSDPDTIGFSLRLGRNTKYCYSKDAPQAVPDFIFSGKGIIKYSWPGCEHDFGYPLEVSSSVYRTADVLPVLKKLNFNNPNTLEGQLSAVSYLFRTGKPAMYCFEKSVAFCNPLNVVQSVSENRFSGGNQYTSEKLADLFEQGRRFDVTRYNGFVTNACHHPAPICLLSTQSKSQPESTGYEQKPLVSIYMVTYNTARFISRAIESVLSQTFRNFELLVVDDGSIDNTAEIVSKYTDPRVRYVYKEHENFASGMNRAIKEARGDFVIGVDSDDFISRDYIYNLVRFAVENPSADYYYPRSFVLVDENDKPMNQWDYQIFSDGNEVAAYLFNQACSPIPNPGSLKRKDLFSRTGLYEPLETIEDFDFLCRNSSKINFCRVDSASPYYYRRLDTGNSHKYQARNRIMASSLNEMVRLYNPLLLCPQLNNIEDEEQQLRFFYKFLYETFTRHSRAPMVKHPEYFVTCANIYKNKLYELEESLDQREAVRSSDNQLALRGDLSDNESLVNSFRNGVRLLRSGNPRDAMSYFDRVLEGGYDDGNLHYARAVAFVQLGDLASADRACRSGLELRPDITQAKVLLDRIQQYHNT